MNIPPPNGPTTPAVRRWQWCVFVAIFAVAAAIRIASISHESFWIDELYSTEFSTGHCYVDLRTPRNVIHPHLHITDLEHALPVWRMWTTFSDDSHPPLHYMTLRLWRECFGSSDAAERSLSTVASLAAILFLFDAARRLSGPTVALWACALMAVAHAQIWYAQEARSYAILTALMCAGASALVRIEQGGATPRRVVALGACFFFLMLTHYFAIAGCAALAIYALLRLRGITLKRVAIAAAVAAAAYALLWGPCFLKQLHGFAISDPWFKEDPATHWPLFRGRVLLFIMRYFAEPPRDTLWMARASLLLLFLPLLRLRKRPDLLLPLLWAFVWVALPIGMDAFRTTRYMEHPRYVLAASPAVYLLAAGCLADYSVKWARYLIPAALLSYCLISIPTQLYNNPKPEYRKLGADVARLVHDDDLLICYTPGIGEWGTGIPYLAVDHYAPNLNCDVLFLTKPYPPELLDQIKKYPRTWLIVDSAIDLPNVFPGFTGGRVEYEWGVGHLLPLIPAGDTNTNSTPTTRDK